MSKCLMMGDMSSQPNLIGTVEAAQLLGRSRRTVLRLVNTGSLEPAHVAEGGPAGIFLFNRAEVEALAKKTATR